MIRRTSVALLLLSAACSGGQPEVPTVAPTPVTPVAESASPAELDSLWARIRFEFRHGKWSKAAEDLERILLELPPGDPRLVQARFFLAETHLAQNLQLQAAREFRKVSDEMPNDPLAPEALLRVGDAYAELWRRPELDPSYGQTALATYQELINRYPGTRAAVRGQVAVRELEEKFAIKQLKAAQFYLRLKAYDSAILYLKDLVATYPRASVAPEALRRLVEAYRALGYQEDVQETCGYIRRFHPNAPAARDCPSAPSDSVGTT